MNKKFDREYWLMMICFWMTVMFVIAVFVKALWGGW